MIVYVFKYFGVELMNFTEFGEEKIFLAPMITLSIIPMISFFRILIFIMEEELLKPHIEFAQSKGMSKGQDPLFTCFEKYFTESFLSWKADHMGDAIESIHH